MNSTILDRKTAKPPCQLVNMSKSPEGTSVTGVLHQVGFKDTAATKTAKANTMFDLILRDDAGVIHGVCSSSVSFVPKAVACADLIGHTLTVTFLGMTTFTVDGKDRQKHSYEFTLNGASAEVLAWNTWAATIHSDEVTDAPYVTPAPAPDPLPSGDTDKADDRNMAADLIHMALDRYTFAMVEDRTPYAIPKKGPRIALPFYGGFESLQTTLALDMFEETGAPAGATPIKTALNTLAAMASRSTARLDLRFAQVDGGRGAVIDLGTTSGEVIHVTSDGWQVLPEHPDVVFRRSEITSPIPTPVQPLDGVPTFEELARFVRVDYRDFPLVLAWLVCTLMQFQTPIIAFSAQRGLGKTESAVSAVQLIDPSTAPRRKPPTDGDKMIVSFMASNAVMIDNMTRIEPWLADALCRTVTGDGDVKRKLYADRGVISFSMRRSVMMTGVTISGITGDLADRVVMLDLPKFVSGESLNESELAQAYSAARPKMLGDLLTLTSMVLAELSSISGRDLHRLGDYAKVMLAIDKITGGNCYQRYFELREQVDRDVVEESSFGSMMLKFMANRSDGWVGTSAQLRDEMPQPYGVDKSWPKTPRAFTELLIRMHAQFQACGVNIEREKLDKRHVIRLTVTDKFVPPYMTNDEKALFSDGSVSSVGHSLASLGVRPKVEGEPSGWFGDEEDRLAFEAAT